MEWLESTASRYSIGGRTCSDGSWGREREEGSAAARVAVAEGGELFRARRGVKSTNRSPLGTKLRALKRSRVPPRSGVDGSHNERAPWGWAPTSCVEVLGEAARPWAARTPSGGRCRGGRGCV